MQEKTSWTRGMLSLSSCLLVEVRLRMKLQVLFGLFSKRGFYNSSKMMKK